MEAPWPDDGPDWHHSSSSSSSSSNTPRHFTRNSVHTSDGVIDDAHYQCGLEPFLGPPAENLKSGPNRDCSDILNLNLIQRVLRLAYEE